MKIGILLLMILPVFGFSQTSEEDLVKATINQLFNGMKTSDSILVKKSLTKDATFHSFDMDGKFYTDSPEQFSKQIGKTPKGFLDEKATSWKISIDGKMANAWVPYVFYYKNGGKKEKCVEKIRAGQARRTIQPINMRSASPIFR